MSVPFRGHKFVEFGFEVIRIGSAAGVVMLPSYVDS